MAPEIRCPMCEQVVAKRCTVCDAPTGAPRILTDGHWLLWDVLCDADQAWFWREWRKLTRGAEATA